MQRRNFMLGISGAAALGALASPSKLWAGGRRGQGEDRIRRVLEIHLWGGLSPWESFYLRSDEVGVQRLGGGWEAQRTLRAARYFARDSRGQEILWGPGTAALWRKDLQERARVVVMRHDAWTHEAAIPLSMGALPGGQDLSLAGSLARGKSRFWAGAPASARRWIVPPAAMQSPEFAALRQLCTKSQSRLECESSAVASFLQSQSSPCEGLCFDGAQDGRPCSLKVAARWLNQQRVSRRQPAYLGWVDGGVHGRAGYDVHGSYSRGVEDANLRSQKVLSRLLEELAAVIYNPQSGRARREDELDLEETLIVLKTEFGRGPSLHRAEGIEAPGREHWPLGYTQLLLGAGVQGPSVAGSIGADGRAQAWATPKSFQRSLLAPLVEI